MNAWILYLILGTLSPQLQAFATYPDSTICQQAQKALKEQQVRSVCLPKSQ